MWTTSSDSHSSAYNPADTNAAVVSLYNSQHLDPLATRAECSSPSSCTLSLTDGSTLYVTINTADGTITPTRDVQP
jgi:hypothetical protein